MSRFREAVRFPGPGRRAVALAAVLLVAAVALAAARRGGARDALVVRPATMVFTVEVEGELAAVRSREIGVPPVTEVEFKIASLAPEGAAVKSGDPILGFDTESLERLLAEKESELAEAEKKVEQKEVELRLALLDLEQQLTQVRTELAKAALQADVPEDVAQRIELEKARLDEKGRRRDVQNLEAQRAATAGAGEAELQSLRSQRDRARGRVAELRADVARMTVVAPQDGILVYRTNWRDEKKKVGDSAWFGETILSIPDLTEMRADGFVDEADGGGVREGQPVTLRLEARSDLDLHGRVTRLGRTVRPRSVRLPIKVYKVEIALDRADPTVMRPAMPFRGQIETGRMDGVIAVPRTAVFLRDGGPVVWVRGATGWGERAVKLGRANRTLVEVVSGLGAGDRISPRDLAFADREPTDPPGGTS